MNIANRFNHYVHFIGFSFANIVKGIMEERKNFFTLFIRKRQQIIFI